MSDETTIKPALTQEDVDKLRALARYHHAEASQWANSDTAVSAPRFAGGHQARHEALAAWADSLADRIAALLQPE